MLYAQISQIHQSVNGDFLSQKDFGFENRVKRRIAILSGKWPFRAKIIIFMFKPPRPGNYYVNYKIHYIKQKQDKNVNYTFRSHF